MEFQQLVLLLTFIVLTLTVDQIWTAQSSDSPSVLPTIPALPTGPITGDTVDCVNSKFFRIQKENPQYEVWLTDVQRTVERLFAVRKTCDKETKRQAECVSAWNRSAGVEFLRLGLSLFDQKNVTGNPLEILNTFVTVFQTCW